MGSWLILICALLLPPLAVNWAIGRWPDAPTRRIAVSCAAIIPALLIVAALLSVIGSFSAIQQVCRVGGCGMAVANILGLVLACSLLFFISFLFCWSATAFKRRKALKIYKTFK
jgi:ABC-type uncharacterized transport system permease subunit